MFESIPAGPIFTFNQLYMYVNWEKIMSRYDVPVLSLKTLFKTINRNKIAFRIVVSKFLEKQFQKYILLATKKC